MFAVADLAAAYLKGAADLRSAVAGMTREQLLATPVPGKWSTMEVVAHLADFEVVFAERVVRLIAMDRPLLIAADENLYSKNLAYVERDVEEELAVVSAVRAKTARMLRGLTADQWERTGVHSEAGKQTIADIVRYVTNHIPHHLRFVAEKRQALGV